MTEAEHFLIVRNDRLGDALLALPVVSALKDRYPKAQISFLASPYTAPIIRCFEGIDQVIEADDRHAEKALLQIAEAKISAAICLRPTFSNARTLARAEILTRIGTAYRAYSLYFTERVKVHRKGTGLHEADLNLALVKRLIPFGEYQFPKCNLPDDARFEAVNILTAIDCSCYGGIVILHPGSGGSAKEWPLEYYAQVATRFRKEGWLVIATGSASEKSSCEKAIGSERFNFAGATDLLTLAAILQKADLVIACSTGPLHLANALGRKVLGFYPPLSNSLPSRWGPYGHLDRTLLPEVQECQRCRPGAVSKCWCMEQLRPERVFQKALEIIAERTATDSQ